MPNHTTNQDLYIGLMSGTSLDGIDAVIAGFSQQGVTLLHSHFHPYPEQLRKNILCLTTPGDNEIDRMGEIDNEIAEQFSSATNQLLAEAALSPSQISAIGSHGQTIRHRPSATSPFTLQIGNPSLIAERTGICTVADFRRRDMAAGGQGAPLVPAFHQSIFHSETTDRIILNIGGIANITYLPCSSKNERVVGFDTGPGNILMDGWIQTCQGKNYDPSGSWAASGKVIPELLASLCDEEYFSLPFPKSTGREKFNQQWLTDKLEQQQLLDSAPEDIQATLCELTAITIAQAILRETPECNEVLICGGGAHNTQLMERLSELLAPTPVLSTEQYGVHPDWMEALAFAWLAKQTIERSPGNLPEVTGARHPVILGGIYPP